MLTIAQLSLGMSLTWRPIRSGDHGLPMERVPAVLCTLPKHPRKPDQWVGIFIVVDGCRVRRFVKLENLESQGVAEGPHGAS